MTQTERIRLRFGPYKTPIFKYGDTTFCALVGEVVICGLTSARIPWPKGKRKERVRGGGSIILFGALAEAVLKESAQAVAYWWGVGHSTICRWRKALEVERCNEGTHELLRAYTLEPAGVAALEKARAKARDPVRCEKIAASRRGKPRPHHVIEAVIRGHKGKKASAETRRKMSESHLKRRTRSPKAGEPWKRWEDYYVRTLSPADAARETGRTIYAVYQRRRDLRLSEQGTREGRYQRGKPR